ncbi:Nitrogen permease regulator 2 [Agyrium rufum]|nr:Nitrogen permease regulator 2 [Agyrium rufum]
MIKSIFYCKFDVHKGPIVEHQVPPHSITPPSDNPSAPTFLPFDSYASYLIPRQTYTFRSISFCTPTHRILSHPICLRSSTYLRNEFLFTFAIVLPLTTPFHPYMAIIAKLSGLFSGLESSERFLSRDTSPRDTGPVYSVLEILREDLNNYCECMIPLPTSADDHGSKLSSQQETLNIKLFPLYPQPPPIRPHHVPLLTVSLSGYADRDNWDLTLLRIIPFIDGVNSVRRIADLADAEPKLVRKALEHLAYYGCIVLLDIFSFGGTSYGITPELAAFVKDVRARDEGRSFVSSQPGHELFRRPKCEMGGNVLDKIPGTGPIVEESVASAHLDGTRLVELYTTLRPGQSLRNWCIERFEEGMLEGIDIRRFIMFGIVRGGLYRVHRYALWTKGDDVEPEKDSHAIGPTKWPEMARFLDGTHCFDEICTELGISERELMARLKEWRNVHLIQK